MLKRLLLELMSEGINVSFHFDKQRQMVKAHLHKMPYHTQADIPYTTFEFEEDMVRIIVNEAKNRLKELHNGE